MEDILNVAVSQQIQRLLGLMAYQSHVPITAITFDAYVAESLDIAAANTWYTLFEFRVNMRALGKLALQTRIFNDGGVSMGSTVISAYLDDNTATRSPNSNADAAFGAFDSGPFACSVPTVAAGEHKVTVQVKGTVLTNNRVRTIGYQWQLFEGGV